MSVQAISWSLDQAATTDPTTTMVLVGLANHASADGAAAFPTIDRLAAYARCSPRTVQRAITTLLGAGVIREGDQQLVAHRPADRRPIVYDLAMSAEVAARWRAQAKETAEGRRAAAARHGATGPSAHRGDKLSPPENSPADPVDDLDGVTPVTPRGDTGDRNGVTPVSPKPYVEPSGEPSLKNTSPSLRSGESGQRAECEVLDLFGGEPRQPRTKAGPTQLPTGWAPTAAMLEWARANIADTVDVAFETRKFTSHFAGKRKTDWARTWRNWMLNAEKFAAQRGTTGAGGGRRFYTDEDAWGPKEQREAEAAAVRENWKDFEAKMGRTYSPAERARMHEQLGRVIPDA